MQSADVEVRAQAAQALAEIGDPDSADLFANALADADERVRARGAQGLNRIGNARALEALVRTIDDVPDILHTPYTLSVYGVVGLGARALPALAPLLKAPHPLTRARAMLAIRQIASGMTDVEALSRTLGAYDANAPQDERDRIADRWSEWIAKH
jgi:HEAT repeat protein